jgi:hypothetical protein
MLSKNTNWPGNRVAFLVHFCVGGRKVSAPGIHFQGGLMRTKKLPGMLAAGVLLSLMAATPAMAQTPADLKIGMDTVWVLITASLVFFMNLGFALVESGFCRAKNTVNILSKNFIVFAISCLAFYVFGWGLMFGNGTGFIGLDGLFALSGADNSPATGDAYLGAYKSIAWTGVPISPSPGPACR